ncbi:N-acetylglucosamine-6-phosphate deacetylase [Gloeocapsa sp. PCC 73106]|uniref:N-acetylglucosamine-6-phosphate deacetylase n=1 Tax=Gloeocapsa sp. PCC 73106 TaxID=102232 RepID=UPI0002ACF7AA|nr:N-acetylglucosamine-6-phosphate deacetylase [Gloeocapsa sp. PCC 73106]ELS00072.1 N-acetylglucosamine-6-phosphate deacetylase [Gloeocapsa sp. PCC 73106]
MNQSFKIIQARLPGEQELQEITIDPEGIIESIDPWHDNSETHSHYTVIDLQGDYLSLGGIDLQINGGLGLAFTDLKEPEDLAPICKFLGEQGIDGFLPTIITTSTVKIRRSLAQIAAYRKNQLPDSAQILGVHLEGPFLNPEKRGAHPQTHLLPLTLTQVESLIEDYQDLIKIITLAPELDPRGEVIPYLISRGIIVSLGHSLARGFQALQAFSQGATMITHAFNAMPSLHHRESSLLAEGIVNPLVYCGLIADGQHVCPTMIKVLLQASNYDQGVFLVSDALAPMGLPDGEYPWDNRQIEVKQGTARLIDGTLAGTTLPLLVGVENLVRWKICDLPVAIALATESPRRALSLPGITPGQKARFLRWRWDGLKSRLNWSRIF